MVQERMLLHSHMHYLLLIKLMAMRWSCTSPTSPGTSEMALQGKYKTASRQPVKFSKQPLSWYLYQMPILNQPKAPQQCRFFFMYHLWGKRWKENRGKKGPTTTEKNREYRTSFHKLKSFETRLLTVFFQNLVISLRKCKHTTKSWILWAYNLFSNSAWDFDLHFYLIQVL